MRGSCTASAVARRQLAAASIGSTMTMARDGGTAWATRSASAVSDGYDHPWTSASRSCAPVRGRSPLARSACFVHRNRYPIKSIENCLSYTSRKLLVKYTSVQSPPCTPHFRAFYTQLPYTLCTPRAHLLNLIFAFYSSHTPSVHLPYSFRTPPRTPPVQLCTPRAPHTNFSIFTNYNFRSI